MLFVIRSHLCKPFNIDEILRLLFMFACHSRSFIILLLSFIVQRQLPYEQRRHGMHVLARLRLVFCFVFHSAQGASCHRRTTHDVVDTENFLWFLIMWKMMMMMMLHVLLNIHGNHPLASLSTEYSHYEVVPFAVCLSLFADLCAIYLMHIVNNIIFV